MYLLLLLPKSHPPQKKNTHTHTKQRFFFFFKERNSIETFRGYKKKETFQKWLEKGITIEDGEFRRPKSPNAFGGHLGIAVVL